ncbi:MAG: hypothetical protein OSJ66_03080 [Clostridia bacterium]|nr:hypothetical protein [Clostridia bacterium]
MKKIFKTEDKILIMLAFFSISVGLWGNFRQLWLQDNGLEASIIAKLLSISTLICAMFIFMIAKKIKIDRLKNFIMFCLIAKSTVLFGLFQFNHTNWNELIRLLIILDVLFEKLIIISIYPFITTIKKTDKLYSKRKLIEYIFRDVGILIGGLFIGKTIYQICFDYNLCLLISILFLVFACLVVANIKITINSDNKSKENNNCLRYILKDDILIIYFLNYFVGNIAMNTGLGLKMLMLTNFCEFSDSVATNYLLILGLIADVIGIVALKYLTSKNDYITVMLKFGIRFLFYIIAFCVDTVEMTIIAISWSILISTAYENIIDAPYINRVSTENQLTFTNYRYIIGILGESIGLSFAGKMYAYGATSMLGLSAFFMVFQIGLSCTLIYMRHNKKRECLEVKENGSY